MGGQGSGRKKKMGRPTKLTKQISEDVVKLMRAGNYFETAVAASGALVSTGRDWLIKGNKQKRGVYKDFSTAVKEAEAFAEASGVSRIRMYGGKTWQAEAWFLERRFPRKWGRWERKEEPTDKEPRKLTLTEEKMSDGEDNAAVDS